MTMQKFLKRIVAGVATLALALSLVPTTQALTVDPASTSYAGTTITVATTDAYDFSVGGQDIASWSVRDSSGTLISDNTSVTSSVSNQGVDTFDIDDSVAFVGLAADTYSVSFVTQDSSQGAGILSVGGANVVTVTATVEPTLAFSLSTNTLDLGALVPGVYNTASLTYTITTNSSTGATVTMDADGLQTATDEIGVADLDLGGETLEANSYYKISTAAAGTVNFQDTGAVITSTAGADVLATGNAIYSSAAPGSATGDVTLGATPNAAPQGSYAGTNTYLASATF